MVCITTCRLPTAFHLKKGNNIAEQMKPPPGAVSDSTAIRYIYEKNGKRFEWSPEQLPADFETYTYVDRIDRLVRKEMPNRGSRDFHLRTLPVRPYCRSTRPANSYSDFCTGYRKRRTGCLHLNSWQKMPAKKMFRCTWPHSARNNSWKNGAITSGHPGVCMRFYSDPYSCTN